MKTTKLLASIVVIMVVLALSSANNAGSLEPDAPPGPTMKTLDEVEPGTPISSVPYTIVESGSYYLSANAQTMSNMFDGITVLADNVTIDLKGFSLIGDGTAGKHGVFIESGRINITIRNGTIANWGGSGVQANGAAMCRVESIQVRSNGPSGIYLAGGGHLVSGCMVSDNGASATGTVYSIYTGYGSTVTGNTVNQNGKSATNYVYGIKADSGSTVTGNTVFQNGTSARGTVYGIYAYFGCTVTGNTSHKNGALAFSNVYGIYAGGHCLVDQNTAYNNTTNMHTGTGCQVGLNVAP